MPDWDSDVLQKAGRLENPRPLWITTLLWYLPAVKQSQAKPTWLSEQGYVKKKKISSTPTAAFQAFKLRHLLS